MLKNTQHDKKISGSIKIFAVCVPAAGQFSMLTQHLLLVHYLLTLRSLSISLPWVW